MDESVIQQATKEAARSMGLFQSVSSHALRRAFAMHLLEDGYDIRTIRERHGYQDINTTMIDIHVLNRGSKGATVPSIASDHGA